MFAWILPSGGTRSSPSLAPAAITHVWATTGPGILNRTRVRYYIDGESTASIDYFFSLGCGVGFGDGANPWGNEWFGKGSTFGAHYNNFRIPFQKSIRVTVANLGPIVVNSNFFFIVRGLPNVPLNVGPVSVPGTARMALQVFDETVPPLKWVPVADVPRGWNGVFFMQSMAVTSGNGNFMEGCYHSYSPRDEPFPGTLLSSGMEDYFDSG